MVVIALNIMASLLNLFVLRRWDDGSLRLLSQSLNVYKVVSVVPAWYICVFIIILYLYKFQMNLLWGQLLRVGYQPMTSKLRRSSDEEHLEKFNW